MRVLVAVVLAALPGIAAAQSQPQTESTPPLPRIGLPLASIGLPLPSPPGSRVDRPVDRDRRPPRREHPGGDKGDRRRGRTTHSVVYFVPAYGLDYRGGAPGSVSPSTDVSAQRDDERPEEPARPTGTLWLDVQSAGGAQVYVDRLYVGTIEETGAELTLDAGAHTVEVRAAGYQPLDVDVKIEAGRAITYRGELQPQAALDASSRAPEKPAPAAQKTAARKPFYSIPGCYLGDVPPQDANLPATCDPKRAVTIWP